MSQTQPIDLTSDDEIKTLPPPPALRRSSNIMPDCPVPLNKEVPAATAASKKRKLPLTTEESHFVLNSGLGVEQLNAYLDLDHTQRKGFVPIGFPTDDETSSLDDFEFDRELEIFDSIETKLCSHTDQLSAITQQLNIMQGQLFKLVSAQRKPVVPLAAYAASSPARPKAAYVKPFEPQGGSKEPHPRQYPKNAYKRPSSAAASFSERFNK
jgi:hypothetical protein